VVQEYVTTTGGRPEVCLRSCLPQCCVSFRRLAPQVFMQKRKDTYVELAQHRV
jgi:hypothetical protein